MTSYTPPGWPRAVPPPGAEGWQRAATEWLLDQCPADYRGYSGWRRYPLALAWIATRHLDGQLAAMRQAYREARAELSEQVPAEALPEILDHLQAEGLRLRAASRGAALVYEALQGHRYIPRL